MTFYNHNEGIYIDEALSEASEILSLPIRAFNGNGTQLANGIASTWAPEEAEGCGISVEQGNEHGITVVPWGSLSRCESYERLILPPSIFDEDRDSNDRCVYDSIKIESPDTEFTAQIIDEVMLAEIGERVVTMPFNYNWVDRPTELKWDWLIEAISKSADPEFIAEASERRYRAAQEAFIEAGQNRGGEIENIRGSIAELENAIAKYTDDISRWRQDLRDKQEVLDVILARRNSGDLVSELESEWEALLRNEKIADLRWVDACLLVYTKELEITHPYTGETAILGSFAISFHPESLSVRVKNLTHRRGFYDHPHINRGSICAGDLQNTLNELLSRRELAAAVNMVLSLLGRCTPDDEWGRHIEWWFGAEDSPNPTITEPELA